MDLKDELDTLIAAVHEHQRRENHALLNIASVIHRYALAKVELIELGGAVDSMRNPPPLPTQQAAASMPPPPPPPTHVGHDAAQAEAEVAAQWEEYRRQTPRPRTYAE